MPGTISPDKAICGDMFFEEVIEQDMNAPANKSPGMRSVLLLSKNDYL